MKLEYSQDWQTKARGNNDDEYQIYLSCADDGTGHEIMTGEPLPAQRAYELGMVNEVAPLKDLRAVTETYVNDILRCAPLAVRATKASAMQGLDHPLRDAFQRDYPEELARRASLDALEGPRAFAEKRVPIWQGR